jgi:hypothetical protein
MIDFIEKAFDIGLYDVPEFARLKVLKPVPGKLYQWVGQARLAITMLRGFRKCVHTTPMLRFSIAVRASCTST